MAAPVLKCVVGYCARLRHLNTRTCAYTTTRYLSGDNKNSEKTTTGIFLGYNLCVSDNTKLLTRSRSKLEISDCSIGGKISALTVWDITFFSTAHLQ